MTTEIRNNVKEALHDHPVLLKVPGVAKLRKIVDSEHVDIVTNKMSIAKDFSEFIVTTTSACKSVIADIKRGSVESNPEHLKKYSNYISKLSTDISNLLQR